jgi:hypothetical protein
VANRQTYPVQIKLSALGAGTASFTARYDFYIIHTRILLVGVNNAALVKQSTAILDLNGKDFEGSDNGNNDQSDTKHLMLAGDILECAWTGADANVTATLTIRGFEFPAGTGIQAVLGGIR